MAAEGKRKSGLRVLGIEGGGTKTTWVFLDANGKTLQTGHGGTGNSQMLSEAEMMALLQSIRDRTGPGVDMIGGAFAGCHLERERVRLRRFCQKVWPAATQIVIGEDTGSAMAGAHGTADGIIVIAGTGANVVGRKGKRWEKACGWGHIFSDEGSGYDVARRGLQATFRAYARTKTVGLLGQSFLRLTAQSTMEEMVPWILEHDSKTQVAALAPAVFQAAQAGDVLAKKVLAEGLEELADRVHFVTKRLGLKNPPVGLIGSLFEKGPGYFRGFTKALRKKQPGSKVFVNRTPGAVGAARMVMTTASATSAPAVAIPSPIPYQSALTEQRNPRSRGLDRKKVPQLVDLFISEEKKVEEALWQARPSLIKACELVAGVVRRGGRVFYVGAGTSGRLGVVDASEMPPTFNADPATFQAIIAGGSEAVFRSQEGAEDDAGVGETALRQRGVGKKDVVVGLAASGTTPFVMGALRAARSQKGATILVTCNPNRPDLIKVDVAVDLPVGAELVTGSTRLKAGTVTKLVLNMLSTIAMVRNGRVKDNLMVAVQATNQKLKDRAMRLVMTLRPCSETEARKRLDRVGWDVRRAL
jgi:N-acetylmuramic acid 6-phosphate etherase